MPGRRFRIYSREFKEAAVRRILAGERFAAVAKDLRLKSQLLYAWRDLYEQGGADALVPRGRPRRAEAWARRRALLQPPSTQARRYGHAAGEAARAARLVELERKVGQQALELDFFKEALRHVREPLPPTSGRGGTASSRSSTR